MPGRFGSLAVSPRPLVLDQGTSLILRAFNAGQATQITAKARQPLRLGEIMNRELLDVGLGRERAIPELLGCRSKP